VRFQFFRPTGILANFIKHYWVLEAQAWEGEISERVIPTGNIELMFHYGKPFHMKVNDKLISEQPQSFISGISSNYADVTTKGETGVIAVTFFPYGACNFFKFPLQEVENTNVSLTDIFSSQFRYVEEKICTIPSLTQKIETIEQFLLECLFPAPHSDVAFLRHSISLIDKRKGLISAAELSEHLFVSNKSLERKFGLLIGKTPKQFTKIVRFQETIRRLSSNRKIQLTELAYENGYFDQAHFIKDFKTLSGYTPREFMNLGPCRSDYFE
jgi:AraC-like DNA-binding protein